METCRILLVAAFNAEDAALAETVHRQDYSFKHVSAHKDQRDYIYQHASSRTLALLRLTSPRDQGVGALSSHLPHQLKSFRPHLAILYGICAGYYIDADKGDIIMTSAAWSAGPKSAGQSTTNSGALSGKLAIEFFPSLERDLISQAVGGFEANLRERFLKPLAAYLPRDRQIEEELKRLQFSEGMKVDQQQQIKSYLKKHIATLRRRRSVRVHTGPLLCVDAVTRDQTIWEHAQRIHRQTRALEMESIAFARACHDEWVPFVILKGIQDQGEEHYYVERRKADQRYAVKRSVARPVRRSATLDKSELWRDYARYISASAVLEFVKRSSALQRSLVSKRGALGPRRQPVRSTYVHPEVGRPVAEHSLRRKLEELTTGVVHVFGSFGNGKCHLIHKVWEEMGFNIVDRRFARRWEPSDISQTDRVLLRCDDANIKDAWASAEKFSKKYNIRVAVCSRLPLWRADDEKPSEILVEGLTDREILELGSEFGIADISTDIVDCLVASFGRSPRWLAAVFRELTGTRTHAHHKLAPSEITELVARLPKTEILHLLESIAQLPLQERGALLRICLMGGRIDSADNVITALFDGFPKNRIETILACLPGVRATDDAMFVVCEFVRKTVLLEYPEKLAPKITSDERGELNVIPIAEGAAESDITRSQVEFAKQVAMHLGSMKLVTQLNAAGKARGSSDFMVSNLLTCLFAHPSRERADLRIEGAMIYGVDFSNTAHDNLEFRGCLFEKCKCPGLNGAIQCFALATDDRFIVSGDGAGFIILTRTEALSQQYVLGKHASAVFSVHISHCSGLLISSSQDAEVRIFDISKPDTPPTQIRVLRSDDPNMWTSVTHTAPDGSILIAWLPGLRGKPALLWILEDSQSEPITYELPSELAKDGFVRCAAFDRTGTLLALGYNDGRVELMAIRNRCELLGTIHGVPLSVLTEMTPVTRSAVVRAIDFNYDSTRLVFVTDFGDCFLCNAQTCEIVARRSVSQKPLRVVAFDNSGTRIACSGSDPNDQRLYVFSVYRDQRAEQILPAGDIAAPWIRVVKFSSIGDVLYTGSDDGRISALRKSDLVIIKSTLGGVVLPRSIAVSDANVVATGGDDRQVHIAELSQDRMTMTFRTTLRGPNNAILAVAISPSGNSVVAIGVDSCVALWRRRHQRWEGPFKNTHDVGQRWNRAVSFLGTDSYFAVGSEDGTIRFFEVDGESIQLRSQFGPLQYWIASIAYNELIRIGVAASFGGDLLFFTFEAGRARQIGAAVTGHLISEVLGVRSLATGELACFVRTLAGLALEISARRVGDAALEANVNVVDYFGGKSLRGLSWHEPASILHALSSNNELLSVSPIDGSFRSTTIGSGRFPSELLTGFRARPDVVICDPHGKLNYCSEETDRICAIDIPGQFSRITFQQCRLHEPFASVLRYLGSRIEQ